MTGSQDAPSPPPRLGGWLVRTVGLGVLLGVALWLVYLLLPLAFGA